MKITMDYDLPDDDPEFEMAINGAKYYNVLDGVIEHLRLTIKHSEAPEQKIEVYEEIQGLIYDLLREYGASIP